LKRKVIGNEVNGKTRHLIRKAKNKRVKYYGNPYGLLKNRTCCKARPELPKGKEKREIPMCTLDGIFRQRGEGGMLL